jgi:hypothetical protein
MSDDPEQKVRERAYAIWEKNGGGHGRHEEHWSQAEQESNTNLEDGSAPTQQQPAEGSDDALGRLQGSAEA